MHNQRFQVETPGRSLTSITDRVARVVAEADIRDGLCHVFLHHTSASLIISENADPAVCRDLERFMERLVSDGDPLFEHDDEGPDDMAAHVRSILTSNDLTIPVANGRLALGTWQGIWLWEHRYAPHRRSVTVTVAG